MDKESTYGQMEGDTKESGKTIICTVKVSTNGKMEENTWDSI